MKNFNNLNLKKPLEKIEEQPSGIIENSNSYKNYPQSSTIFKKDLLNPNSNTPSVNVHINRKSDSFLIVTLLQRVNDEEILGDFSKYGKILNIYKEENGKFYKIIYDNYNAIRVAVFEIQENLKNKDHIKMKYKVEEGNPNIINNLKFNNLVYENQENKPFANPAGFSREFNQDRNKNYQDNIGAFFGSNLSSQNSQMQRNTDNYNKAQTLPIDEFNLRNQDYLRNRKNDFDAYDYDADFRQGNANFIKDDPNKITSLPKRTANSKAKPSIPYVSIFDCINDLFFSY